MSAPFETFEVQPSDEVWGSYYVTVKPGPHDSYGGDYKLQEKQQKLQVEFIEAAINEKLERVRLRPASEPGPEEGRK